MEADGLASRSKMALFGHTKAAGIARFSAMRVHSAGILRFHILAMSLSTRSSTERNGSLHSTVR